LIAADPDAYTSTLTKEQQRPDQTPDKHVASLRSRCAGLRDHDDAVCLITMPGMRSYSAFP
jgi:hypothetical protein